MKFKPTFDSEWVEWPYWRGPTREDCAEVESGMPLFWSLESFGTKERIYALKWADGSEWHSGLGFGYESGWVENKPQDADMGYYVIYSDEGGPIARIPIRYIDGKWRHFPIEPIPEPDQ